MNLPERFHPSMPISTEHGLQSLVNDGLIVTVGKYSYGVPQVSWARADKGRQLKIGSFCSIAVGVSVYVGMQGRHTTDFLSTYPIGMIFPSCGAQGSSTAFSGNLDVIIGSDVWVGRDSLIMAGVTIGDGAIIASRAVVTTDVPPYSVVGGVPAKLIKYRFENEVVRRLISVKWWDFPDSVLIANSDIFYSNDMEYVCERLEAIAQSAGRLQHNIKQ